MEMDQILKNLEIDDDNIFRLSCQQIITMLSSKLKIASEKQDSSLCESVQSKLLEIIAKNKDIGKETILLASQAFWLLSRIETMELLKNRLKDLLQVNTLSLEVLDFETFKLTIAYGYLQINDTQIYTQESCSVIFFVTYPHCMRYTEHSYFAYKILHRWLIATSTKSNFWENSTLELENCLQAIIFSNWDNSIEDLGKRNVSYIFPLYLNIMKRKYVNFLEFIFYKCVDNVCWSHITKFMIFAEICKIWDNVEAMTEADFVKHVVQSLTESYLRSSCTNLYENIAKKLDDKKWMNTFGIQIKKCVNQWYRSKNDEAIQVIFKRWVEPTVKSRGHKFAELYNQFCIKDKDFKSDVFCTHIKEMCNDGHYSSLIEENGIFHMKNEYRTVQFFSVLCRIFRRPNSEREKLFKTIILFLNIYANTESIYLRHEIFRYFKGFFLHILKRPIDDVQCFTILYNFIVDCFEIGSTYQRKIFGLNIYKIVLCFTSGESVDGVFIDDISRRELKNLDVIKNVEMFTDKKMLFLMLKLVLDPASNVRKMAAEILMKFFNSNPLSLEEKLVLWKTAKDNSNSLKFYEIESGAMMYKILCTWLMEEPVKKDLWLLEAKSQLDRVKKDILKASTKNAPFYGVMTVISINVFYTGPESYSVDNEYLTKLLDLLEDAVQFFLQTLFIQSSNAECSSSFAEMGIAINEAIKNSEINEEYDELILSPAHQNIINCIWRSLKISSELAKEIALISNSSEIKRRSGFIIMNILMKCRHKGAIEAAGVAMGELCRNLCQNNTNIDLVQNYLKKLLKNDEESNANITRRGAGLTIMFHRIVANDIRKDKPLVRYAIRTLLDSLKKKSQFVNSQVDSNHDDPRVMHLYFLRNVVINKELLSHVTPYLEDIYLMALKYMQSQMFMIRNASLQLIGALIPRLSGQRTATYLDFGCGYSVNHLVTHYPRLTQYILTSLKETLENTTFTMVIQKHSSVIHILILFSKLSVGGCELIDDSAEVVIKYIKYHLRALFKSPVIHVRKLSAKAYAALTSRSEIKQELKNLALTVALSNNKNAAHGNLLAFNYLKTKLIVEFGAAEFDEIDKKRLMRFWALRCGRFAEQHRVCFVVEKLLLDNPEILQILDCLKEIPDTCLKIDEIKLLILPVKMTSFPGFHDFVDQLIYLSSTYLEDYKSAQFIEILLTAPYYGYGIALLKYFQSFPLTFIRNEINLVLESIKSISNTNTSLFNILQPEVVIALAKYKIFNCSNQNIFNKIIMSKDDENKIMLKSKIVRLCNQVFPKLLKNININDFEKLTDVEKHLFAQLLPSFPNYFLKEVYFYFLLIARNHVPQVREIVEENILQKYYKRDTLTTDDFFFVNSHDYFHNLLLNSILDFNSENKINKFLEMSKSILDFVQVHQSCPEYPYDENDITAYRDDVKFLNMFYAELLFLLTLCSKFNLLQSRQEITFNLNKKVKDCYMEYNVLRGKNIEFTLKLTESIQQEMRFDITNLESFLNISCAEYLLLKKKTVLKMVESKKWIELSEK